MTLSWPKNVRGFVVYESQRVNPAYGLHPYQRQVLDDLMNFLRPNPQSVVPVSQRAILHMPTGAGKTRVACYAACNLLGWASAENKVVVWLSSTEELCDQAADDLTLAWSYLGNRAITIYRYWGGSTLNLEKLESGFLVAGLPKLWAASGSDVRIMRELAEITAGVIFDEAHQAIARTYQYITEQLLSYNPPLLGLTATPGRTAEVSDSDYHLAEMFASNKVTIDPKGHGNPVTYLIRQGYLADPEFTSFEISSQVQIAPPEEGLDYTAEDLRALGDDETWQRTIVETTLTALGMHKRVIVFCPSVESVRKCAEAVNEKDAIAEIVLGDTPHEKRRDRIARFKEDNHEPIALFNYGVLTAGFDAPLTRCVVIGRPTTSLVLYSQMVGRAMRGPRSGGNRNCQVFTVIDTNLPGFGSVAEAFTNWEELWICN